MIPYVQAHTIRAMARPLANARSICHCPTPDAVYRDCTGSPVPRRPFALGRTDAGYIPERKWCRLIVDCLNNASRRMSEYGDPAGLWELRELM